MTLDVVIGNPPYQDNIIEDETNRSVGKQLFPLFIINAINTARVVSLITPSRWFTGDSVGGTFANLRYFVKNNNHFKSIVHFEDASTIFKGNLIKGGVNYFLCNRDYSGEVEFTSITNKSTITQVRPLFIDDLDVIIRDETEINIIRKVRNREFTSLKLIVSGTDAFGISGKEDNVDKLVTNSVNKDLTLICKQESTYKIDRAYVTKSAELIDRYKVIISKSAGDPCVDRRILGRPYIAGPGVICSDSLIVIGSFGDMDEAMNLLKYMQTKFLRYMVSIMKISQNVRQSVYELVPMQDFTKSSDINWNDTIQNIDTQLYRKYKLSDSEILSIENRVEYIRDR